MMSWADATKSLADLIFEGVSHGLASCGVQMESVDSVVLAAHDLIDGRSLSSMVTAPAAGAYFRDEIRVTDDGLSALSLASARVASGESEVSIVAAWGRASEADFLNTSRAAMDPFLLQPFGISEFDVSSMRLSHWLSKNPDRDMDRCQALLKRQACVDQNPRALAQRSDAQTFNFPMRQQEGPRWADVVSMVVIGSKPSAVRLAGIGHGTDMPMIGDRDLLAMPALHASVAGALKDAGTEISEIDLFEIDGITLPDEAMSIEAMGLCGPGNGFAHYAATPAINPSGGSGAGWCYPAMGLVRLAECYLQMTGNAGASQCDNSVTRAMAVGTSPVAAQTVTSVILEAV